MHPERMQTKNSMERTRQIMCIFYMHMSHKWVFSAVSPCNYGEWRDREINTISFFPHIAAAYKQLTFFEFQLSGITTPGSDKVQWHFKVDLKVSLTF